MGRIKERPLGCVEYLLSRQEPQELAEQTQVCPPEIDIAQY